jgi:hypothetical protein
MKLPAYGARKTTKQRINRINLNHPIFRDVFDYVPENIDLPSVFSYYEIGRTARSGMEGLLTLQNGSIFLGVQDCGSGKAYVLASPLDMESSSFPSHAIFVPALYKIALLSQQQQQLYHIIGKNERIDYRGKLLGGDRVMKVIELNGKGEFIPEQITWEGLTDVYVHDQIKEAGHYYLGDGKEMMMPLAFNYSREESQLDAYNVSELKDMAARAGLKNVTIFENSDRNLTSTILDLNLGIRLWKLFIILALVFLVAEVVLLRWWK